MVKILAKMIIPIDFTPPKTIKPLEMMFFLYEIFFSENQKNVKIFVNFCFRPLFGAFPDFFGI